MFVRALLLAVCVLVLSAAPASAHTRLVASDPAEGAALPAAPARVALTFSEPVGPRTLAVRGPGGAAWTVGAMAASGEVLTADVVPAGPAGAYTLEYEVVAQDGHPVRGTVAFTLTAPAPTPTTTTTTTTAPPATKTAPTAEPIVDAVPPIRDPGLPQWAWWLIGIGGTALIAAVIVAVVRVSRR